MRSWCHSSNQRERERERGERERAGREAVEYRAEVSTGHCCLYGCWTSTTSDKRRTNPNPLGYLDLPHRRQLNLRILCYLDIQRQVQSHIRQRVFSINVSEVCFSIVNAFPPTGPLHFSVTATFYCLSLRHAWI